ncbi:uncharacterized protein I303_101111 [Kwoniella dejecticola CBS 10117]|uniref:Apple domain-containing protein n=1 Tax=Kwoniella dejecticola CBS 10117 TaxID=1296121 RepID=A0A1A6AGT9_9TREE|nr:uncharacterized protein I303_01115 [Kwoniella dejecticola CBS 10117]OBR89290.1 hypothetical protein I303_01115 [Kwoniella dejecticola CBS 10117]
MYASLAHTVLPLSLLGSALAGVIRIRGDDDNANPTDAKKHHDDDKKHHEDNNSINTDVSPQFIGCVSRTFFNLVSSDDNFDGDFTEQPDLQTCIEHCVEDKFRYTYWDADRKQCYCSPAQRPDAEQIRDNDATTGRCKTRDAIVFLNNATFRFGGCFGPLANYTAYGVQPVARFSTTSVRDCFVLCDQPCRDQYIDVVAISPRFDPALYAFAYDCACFDIDYHNHPPVVNRTCAIDSEFAYYREDHHNDDHKKNSKRGEYDDVDWYGKKYHHEAESDYDHDHKKDGQESDNYAQADHDKDDHDYSPDNSHKKGDDDWADDSHKDDYDPKKHHDEKDVDNQDNDYDHDKGYQVEDPSDEDQDYDHKKHHDDDHGKDHDENDEDEQENDDDKKHHDADHDHEKNHENEDQDDNEHDHKKDHEAPNNNDDDHHKDGSGDAGDDDSKKHHEDDSGHHKKQHDYKGDEYNYDYGYYGRRGESRVTFTQVTGLNRNA